MPKPLAPVHYLRPNEREFTPSSVIFLDTETRQISSGDEDLLGLRLWVATYGDRRQHRRSELRQESAWGRTGGQLAAWVDRVTQNRESVWLYAHNLGFDLTTSRLPMALVPLGWSVRDAAVGGNAPWIRLGKGRRVLTITDSWSWLPLALDDIATHVGKVKPPLPDDDAAEHEWRSRCGADVDVLATAVLTLMDWWDANELGNWTITGAACGWNAYRHTETPFRVVVDPDPVTVKAERTYVHGGRRGTWQIGQHAAGPFYELDFVAAYPTIAAHLPHPVRRMYAFDTLETDSPLLTSDRHGVTARVRIATDTPRWPVRVAGGTFYPVGEFWADLAGPDVTEAVRLDCLREVGAGHVHQLAPQMAPWARWCLAAQFDRSERTPAVARAAAKSWGRSVIGKWGQRSYTKEALGPAPNYGWGYEAAWDHAGGCAGGFVDIAGQRWWVSSDGDPDNVYPAITAWIEAEVRVRLARVIEAIGERAMIQCDTDGMIVKGRLVGTRAAGGHLIAPDCWGARARLNWVLDNLNPVTAPLDLRVKRQLGHVDVLGPQHLTADGQRRFAGMPKHAQEQEDGSFSAKAWPGLQWQMSHGSPRGYVRPTQKFSMKTPKPTGWLLLDKTVVPVETAIDNAGRTYILPWQLTRYAKAGIRRADIQHPLLDAII